MEHIKNTHFSWWYAYQRYIREIILPYNKDDLKNSFYLRDEIFFSILIYFTPLSIIALIPGVYMSFLKDVPIVGFVDLSAFLLLILIMVKHNLSLHTRKVVFISIFYLLSVVLIYYVGKAGPGLLFLLTLTVLSSVIYSSSAGYYSAWANTFICIAFGVLNYFEAEAPVVIDYSLGTWIAVTSNLVLLSFACAKCLDLLLGGLTTALLDNKTSEEKLRKANRLYHFISQINQSIVHIKDEESLFRITCKIAFETGKFKMSWIGKFDIGGKKITLIEQNGIPGKNIHLFNTSYENNGPQDYVVRTGSYYVCNDIENDLQLESWKPFAQAHGIRSCIVLPIKNAGITIGTFNLYAGELNFFDEEEIGLLEEATGDISFALDVFEKERKHKNAEELIIKNENRFRSLIEKSTDMKMLTNITGEFMYSSPSVIKLFEYSMEEILNKSAFTFFHPDDIPDLVKNRMDILQTAGKSFSFQYRLLHKNGHWIWCEGTLTNMLHEPGIQAFVSNFKDISDRKAAEQELATISDNLRKALNGLQKIMDSSVDIICSIDEEGKFAELSAASENILGYRPDELRGIKYIDMVCSEDVEKTIKVANEIMSGTPISFFENRCQHKNGSMIPILWSAAWDDDDKLMYCIAKDVTEIKSAGEEKEKMISSIVQHSKNLEQFTSIVSHNLRAPVANILGLSNVLKNTISEEDRVRCQEFLFKATEQLDDVFKDLNKILQARSEIDAYKEVVSFHELMDVIKSSIHTLIEKEKVQLIADFNAIDKITSIKSYIHSIFYNLIANSIKYRQPGKTPVIEIKSGINKEKVTISFKDNGLGIDLIKYGDKIFGLYKRFHLNIEGKGLGLFMVKTQIENLGGNVMIRSKPGEGAEFIIELPL